MQISQVNSNTHNQISFRGRLIDLTCRQTTRKAISKAKPALERMAALLPDDLVIGDVFTREPKNYLRVKFGLLDKLNPAKLKQTYYSGPYYKDRGEAKNASKIIEAVSYKYGETFAPLIQELSEKNFRGYKGVAGFFKRFIGSDK